MPDSSQNQTEKFSDNPEESLRIENDILKLKMQAEHGAFFGGDENISPQLENSFSGFREAVRFLNLFF